MCDLYKPKWYQCNRHVRELMVATRVHVNNTMLEIQSM